MSQKVHCDVCDCVAGTHRPITEERSISLMEATADGASTMFRVRGQWVRMSYYFTLPTGEYNEHKKIDICDECAELGCEDAYRLILKELVKKARA